MDILMFSVLVGVLTGVPAWIVWQRAGARRGVSDLRGFDPRDAVPCGIEPVVLNARLLPDSASESEARS